MFKKSLILGVLILSVFLTGCGKTDETKDTVEVREKEVSKRTSSDNTANQNEGTIRKEQSADGIQKINPKEKVDDQDKKLMVEDNDWRLYTNDRLGFSIKVPQKILDKNCGEKDGKVNFKIFEDGNKIYFSSEKVYSFKTKQCYSNSLDIVKNWRGSDYFFGVWEVRVNNVNNETEAQNNLKEYFGNSCIIDTKENAIQEGVFDLKLKDSKGLGCNGQCCLNYIYVIKYSDKYKKVAYWSIGQDSNFVIENKSNSGGFDFEMAESFQFTN
ncbi:MAG: hypothetical protein GF347_05355 [Candidatus Moranbacteria bacterium]|nr:hypothetical protein [Candidatus Moranbacteria bacterium]